MLERLHIIKLINFVTLIFFDREMINENLYFSNDVLQKPIALKVLLYNIVQYNLNHYMT